jgi:CHAT domain-containing protein
MARLAAFHFADQGKGRSLEDGLREKSGLKAARPDMKLLAEDRELSLRISKLASLREPLPEADEQRKKLTEEIDSLQQRRNMIEVELKKSALGGYVAPDFRKPMEMAKELEPDRAVLQYSVGEKEGWLLILTREGVTVHKLGAATQALPELLPRQEPTLSQLADAWNKRADKIGLDGLVRLARARAEDLARPGSPVAVPVADDLLTRTKEPPRQEARRHNLVGAEQEKAILGRLAEVALPDAALAELRKKGIHRLLVIPDGSLHYVPFAMLRLKNEKDAGTHYLVEEFASSYIPAMTTLNTIRKQKQEREKKRPMERRPLLAFANPAYGAENLPSAPPTAAAKDDMLTRLRSFRADNYKNAGLRLTSLPETEQEATRVASLFAPPKTYNKLTAAEPGDQAVVFTGRGACEEEVKQLLAASVDPKARRQWQYVLFSTHGLADTYNGMLSCLALSSPVANSVEDGFLQAQEVMNLEFDADLVMLSACQTGLGRLRGGEGLVGLCAAFFYAGAESVCASLWQVPSGPTSQLVPEFFKRLKEGKVDRSEALRQAQLQVLRQGQGSDGKPTDYSTPFCWAAFVLMGEHR